MLKPADLPDDIAALKALLVASEGRNLRKQDRIDQLEKLVADFRRALFGARSEKTDPEQFELALEDIETAMAVVHAEDAALDPPASRATKPRNTNRGSLPKHLHRIEEVIEPEQTLCGCGAERHVIGEDTSERLDISQVREQPADYGKAYSDFAQKQMDLLMRTVQAMSDLGQKTGTETTELATKAGEDTRQKIAANVQGAADKATSAANKAA